MKKITLLTGTAALMAAMSAPAFAQTEIAAGADATGISGINDRIIDVEDAVQDDFDRDNDDARFGNPDRREGLFGSLALTYAGSTGNLNIGLVIAAACPGGGFCRASVSGPRSTPPNASSAARWTRGDMSDWCWCCPCRSTRSAVRSASTAAVAMRPST